MWKLLGILPSSGKQKTRPTVSSLNTHLASSAFCRKCRLPWLTCWHASCWQNGPTVERKPFRRTKFSNESGGDCWVHTQGCACGATRLETLWQDAKPLQMCNYVLQRNGPVLPIFHAWTTEPTGQSAKQIRLTVETYMTTGTAYASSIPHSDIGVFAQDVAYIHI